MIHSDSGLARRLIQEELFDLTLYEELHHYCRDDLRAMLAELIPVEKRHVAFWQEFFKRKNDRLEFGRRLQLRLLVGACRLFGPVAVQLVLEAIEINGIKKYLEVWKVYKGEPLGAAVRGILNDEFEHEDEIVSKASSRRIHPESIRGIFLGFNDGMVEILGAISGFFAAFHQPKMVLMASSCVATAGALSMAAGAFVASSSEKEFQNIRRGKSEFLGEAGPPSDREANPLRDAGVVGASYFLGASIPAVPVALGAQTLWVPILTGGVSILFVSGFLAFLSGMEIKKRASLNLAIILAAVGVSYIIGLFANRVWGISL